MNQKQSEELDNIIVEGISSYVYQQRIKEKLLAVKTEYNREEGLVYESVLLPKSTLSKYILLIGAIFILVGGSIFWLYYPPSETPLSNQIEVKDDNTNTFALNSTNNESEIIPSKSNIKNKKISPSNQVEVKDDNIEKNYRESIVISQQQDTSTVKKGIDINLDSLTHLAIAMNIKEQSRILNIPIGGKSSIPNQNIDSILTFIENSNWQLYFQKGDHLMVIEILSDYKSVLQKKQPFTNSYLALCYLENKQPKIAIEVLLPLLDEDIDENRKNFILYQLGIAYTQLREIGNGIEVLKKIDFQKYRNPITENAKAFLEKIENLK
jgi:hypothetical protein